METTFNNTVKLTKLLLFGAIISLGLKSNAQCTAGFTMSSTPVSNGEIVTFTNTSSSTSAVSYHWNFGDGTDTVCFNPAPHTYNNYATNQYHICLVIQDSINVIDSTLGCTSTYCDVINIINPVTGSCYANFYAYDSLGSVFVENSSGSYIYGMANPTSYLWDFGDGTTDTAQYPSSHLYSIPGNHIICLTISNPATQCNSTVCDTVHSSSCYGNFTSQNDASGGGVTFTSTVSSSVDIYNWNFGDGGSSAQANPYHNYTSNGYFNVCLTVSSSSDSSCSYSKCNYVYMNGLCDANFITIQDSINTSNFIIYNYSSGSASTNFLWTFGDGTSSTLQFPIHNYPGTGPYQICLTVSDGAGCTDSQCDSIYAGRASGGITVTVVNPVTVGVNDHSTIINSLINYPNPFTNSTTISYSIKQDASVELNVLDLLGNKVAVIESGNKASGTYQTEWNASNISAGIYMLQLKVNNQVSIKKLMISK